MSKKIIFLNMQSQYPFGKEKPKKDPQSFTQVCKTVSFDIQPRLVLREKLRVLKSLGFQNLVAIESTKSQENSMSLFFQYVPLQLLSEMASLSEEIKSRVYNGMVLLCNTLASRFIVHELDVKRVGLDRSYNLKYYLGIDFVINRTISKNKIRQSYTTQVHSFFAHTCKFIQQSKDSSQEKIYEEKYTSVPEYTNSFQSLESELQRNIKNLFQTQDSAPRKLLKKSSIIEEQHKDDDNKRRKASNRFTFNHTNRISLVIPDISQTGQNKQSRVMKSQNLAARISHLKGYIKQIQGKMSNACNSSKYEINQTSKQQRQDNQHRVSSKINDLKQTQQKKLKKMDEKKKSSYTDIKINIHKIASHKQTIEKSKSPSIKESLYDTIKYEPNILSAPVVHKSKKNSIVLINNDRQHQQYIMLAEKDKYCQQFMIFLQDGSFNQKENTSVSRANPEGSENNRLCKKKSADKQKNNNLKDILRTQSSQNALQIQNRVKKVIKSSLKLINCLKAREAIRVQ